MQTLEKQPKCIWSEAHPCRIRREIRRITAFGKRVTPNDEMGSVMSGMMSAFSQKHACGTSAFALLLSTMPNVSRKHQREVKKMSCSDNRRFFECKICGKPCTTLRGLSNHVKRTHHMTMVEYYARD